MTTIKSYLFDVFSTSSDLRMLTVKSPKYQTIEKMRKMCLKVSNTFFIVREKNKKSDGYHFHALLKMASEPKKSWYKKGVHINLLKVGRNNGPPLPPPVFPESKSTLDKELYDGEINQKEHDEALIDVMLAKSMRNLRMLNHVRRVVNYVTKELTNPQQYVNYHLIIRKKGVALTHPPSPGGGGRSPPSMKKDA